MGKLYYLTEEGSTAVQQNFKGPTTPLGFDVYLPDVLAVMSGDQLEIKRLPAVSLSELVNDVPLRRLVVEVLLERLLTAVKPLLSKEDFTSYHTLSGQFRDCLLHRPLPKDELKDLYQTLSFWGDIQIGTKFMAQAQALLYALWLLAALRLEELRQAE
jgi:hypothetical protein